MKGRLVAFKVYKNTDHATTNRFIQKFYGQDVSSHSGKYRSHKHGFLEGIPHIKLQRGVIILLEKDLAAVLNFLNEYKTEIQVREVTLTHEDEKTLTKES
jgi:hypothetical protein